MPFHRADQKCLVTSTVPFETTQTDKQVWNFLCKVLGPVLREHIPSTWRKTGFLFGLNFSLRQSCLIFVLGTYLCDPARFAALIRFFNVVSLPCRSAGKQFTRGAFLATSEGSARLLLVDKVTVGCRVFAAYVREWLWRWAWNCWVMDLSHLQESHL